MLRRIIFLTEGSIAMVACIIGVSVDPGQTALIRTPEAAFSSAAALATSIANLA
jgi:hypothetical protein